MKRLTALAVVALLALPAAASAQTIVRDGADYSGYANPGGCEIFVHDDRPTELHVNCRDAGKARVRYRFLRDVGGTFDPADVSVDLRIHGGDCERAGVRWMVPVPRTVRVVVPAGCYVHIRSVTWAQG